MKFDILKEHKIDKLREVIVFGSGYNGTRVTFLLDYAGIDIIACMDNDPHKWGKLLYDKVVCVEPYFNRDIPIIISVKDKQLSEKIEKQCKKMGYTTFFYPDYEKLENAMIELPDKEWLDMMFFLMCGGRTINWDTLQTFNEKMQWLKLYNRNAEYVKMVDKYEVKDYVKEKIGEDHIIPTLGIWNHFGEIDFEKLPEQFVLKCTHDSGGVVVVRNKRFLNKEECGRKIEERMGKNFFYMGREWPYKNVKPRIIAEELLLPKNGKLPCDYKVSCFHGKAEFFSVAIDREDDLSFNYYDTSYSLINEQVLGTAGNSKDFCLPRRELLNEMIIFAEKVSENIPYVRVDFYIEDKVYFGEMTFFPDAGWGRWSRDWQLYTGGLIRV